MEKVGTQKSDVLEFQIWELIGEITYYNISTKRRIKALSSDQKQELIASHLNAYLTFWKCWKEYTETNSYKNVLDFVLENENIKYAFISHELFLKIFED